MNIDTKDIKIKIKLLSSDKVLAQVSVILFDIWEEHAWKVLKSNQPHKIFGEYVWIQAPSYNAKGSGWKEIVFINDEPLYREVERLIYEAYIRAKDKDEALTSTGELSEEDYKKIDSIKI